MSEKLRKALGHFDEDGRYIPHKNEIEDLMLYEDQSQTEKAEQDRREERYFLPVLMQVGCGNGVNPILNPKCDKTYRVTTIEPLRGKPGEST